MRVAMIGQKGIPATHGGVERHVQELSVRLCQAGHQVLVYNRHSYMPEEISEFRGVRVVTLPSVATKHLDAISHVTLCTLHALAAGADIVHYHAIGPALLSWLPRLRGTAVVVTIHGRDWQRPKWGPTASAALRCGEWMAMHAPEETIVVSESLTRQLAQTYGRSARFIPNGIAIEENEDTTILDELGLEADRYILFASRLVPEKGAHYLMEAYQTAGIEMPLVIAGDSSFSSDYVRTLHAACANGHVILPGFVYGERLAALFARAALFVLPSDVEGLPIVLLEALGHGTPVLASDIDPNREVLGVLGRTFRAGDVDDLRRQLTASLADLPSMREQARRASPFIRRVYDWDSVTTQTIAVYEHALSEAGRAARLWLRSGRARVSGPPPLSLSRPRRTSVRARSGASEDCSTRPPDDARLGA
jgi:glycosyltransferase involved in cell wall biosynthesis